MIVNVKLEQSYNLECLNNLLEKYRDFKSIYREIKINSVLNTKSLLEIDQLYPPILGGFKNEESDNGFWINDIRNSSFSIEKMMITIDNSMEISNIDLEINIIDSKIGKSMLEMIDLIEFRPLISLMSEYQMPSEWKILGFYANLID
jgi:hypothetical protein